MDQIRSIVWRKDFRRRWQKWASLGFVTTESARPHQSSTRRKTSDLVSSWCPNWRGVSMWTPNPTRKCVQAAKHASVCLSCHLFPDAWFLKIEFLIPLQPSSLHRAKCHRPWWHCWRIAIISEALYSTEWYFDDSSIVCQRSSGTALAARNSEKTFYVHNDDW